MTKKILWTNQFTRDYKKIQKQGKKLDKLEAIINLLVEGKSLPPARRDHALKGEYIGCRECHISPDWLLIYRPEKDKLVLYRTGSHSELLE